MLCPTHLPFSGLKGSPGLDEDDVRHFATLQPAPLRLGPGAWQNPEVWLEGRAPAQHAMSKLGGGGLPASVGHPATALPAAAEPGDQKG